MRFRNWLEAVEGLTFQNLHLDVIGRDENVWRLVAVLGGETVGYLDYNSVGDEARAGFLVVAPDFRRRGIGRALVHELLRYFPYDKINWGMTTDDGTALMKSVDADLKAN